MSNDQNYQVFKADDSVVPVKAWINGVMFEEEARNQALRVSKLPFVFKHIALMPDTHMGYSVAIGSVIATKGAIIPSNAGVDLGCGVSAVKTTLTANDLPDTLSTLRSEIEAAIPHGDGNAGNHEKGCWRKIPSDVETAWMELASEYRKIVDKHPKISHPRPDKQAGSLGSGNHFLSAALDDNGIVWLMLHSGSRGPGNNIGKYFIELARKDMERYFINLSDKDLAYLPEGTEHFSDYIEAVDWAQKYAYANRELMMSNFIRTCKKSKQLPKFDITDVAISCHHNYIAIENHYNTNVYITRKGAVRARENDYGVIPGCMGGKSYIVKGKGNKESFQSCAHGAGRAMSRTKARETFTLKDHREATEGVECRKDKSVIDETPGAYKNIDDVMKAQSDLVEIVTTLKEFLVVKG